jgi:MFS family permease
MLDMMLADRATGYYGLFFCAGSISSPIVGSFVYEKLLNENWAHTCEVFALAGALYCVIYTVFNVLPDVHKEGKELEEMS